MVSQQVIIGVIDALLKSSTKIIKRFGTKSAA